MRCCLGLQMTYTEPLLAIFCGIALMGWLRLRRTRGSGLVLLGVAGLFVFSWPPVDWLLSRSLEIWYPVQAFHAEPAQAIVVFSAAVEPAEPARPYPLPNDQTYQRCRYAAWLYHHWCSVPVLACGGSGGGPIPLSWTMREVLHQEAVPLERIWVEDRSGSTHENASFGARILQQRGIRSVVLVVDAKSMPRAAASLRKAGIHVIPAPSEFREFGPFREELLPSWKAIRRNESTLHEIGGLAWYWLRGWI
jgi:uncharacterized SAM-binding protein YcdF (DUF218 family)